MVKKQFLLYKIESAQTQGITVHRVTYLRSVESWPILMMEHKILYTCLTQEGVLQGEGEVCEGRGREDESHDLVAKRYCCSCTEIC